MADRVGKLLTHRQKQVMALKLYGYQAKQGAAALHISVRTYLQHGRSGAVNLQLRIPKDCDLSKLSELPIWEMVEAALNGHSTQPAEPSVKKRTQKKGQKTAE